MILKSVNELCLEWSEWLKTIPVTMSVHEGEHQQGKHSVYIMTVDLQKGDGCDRLYYVGHTADAPKKRASKHKTSFVNCRVTTFVGISALFSPVLMDGVNAVSMNFKVVYPGLSQFEAKEQEKELSTGLRLLYGDAVLTRPNGARQLC
jgi:hypothetical protein